METVQIQEIFKILGDSVNSPKFCEIFWNSVKDIKNPFKDFKWILFLKLSRNPLESLAGVIVFDSRNPENGLGLGSFRKVI